MANNISLNAEDQKNLVKEFHEVIWRMQWFTEEKAMVSFEERVKMHPYVQMENAGNVFIEYHNNELPTNLKRNFEKWVQSENSLSSLFSAGGRKLSKEMKRIIQNTENRLRDEISKELKTISLLSIDLPMSVCQEDLIKDAMLVESFLKKSRTMKSVFFENFKKLSNQNGIYGAILPLVADCLSDFEAGYQAFAKDARKVGEEFGIAIDRVKSRNINEGYRRKNDVKDIFDGFHSKRRNMSSFAESIKCTPDPKYKDSYSTKPKKNSDWESKNQIEQNIYGEPGDYREEGP